MLFQLHAELANSLLVSLKVFTIDTLRGGRWWDSELLDGDMAASLFVVARGTRHKDVFHRK